MALIDDLGHIMLKVTGYVMLFAPLAVWAAIMATVSKNGLGVLWKLIVFMGGFYLSLMILWAILVVVGFIVHRAAIQPSAAADPRAADDRVLDRELRKPPIRRRWRASIASAPRRGSRAFVLPLGYSFNLDGTMMYCTFASIFIAQTYHIDMPLGTQLAMLATLMITSKGVAGVPRASLVVIASTLSQFGIPEAGLLMIMGIDTFLDMGRSATNVIGNSLATAVVAKWEGELKRPSTSSAPTTSCRRMRFPARCRCRPATDGRRCHAHSSKSCRRVGGPCCWRRFCWPRRRRRQTGGSEG